MEIVLIRHGKPTTALVGEHMAKISASGYARWVKAYNYSSVDNSSRADKDKAQLLSGHYVVASDLKRAVESAVLHQGALPQQCWRLLREMDIPRYKLYGSLKPYSWLLLTRILWMLGVASGLSQNVESFKAAKNRADQAATALANLALNKEKVLVFGHGLTNRYIRKSLEAKGWKLVRKSNDYWGETCLIR